MKIAIITSGILPVPAVLGGAVENLIDYALEYNDVAHLHTIDIYSVANRKTHQHQALHSDANNYIYIDTNSIFFKLGAKIHSLLKKQDFYNYKIEYFFEQVWKRVKNKEYDLIILENRPGFALKIKNRSKTPIISHIHTNTLYEPTYKNIEIVKATQRFIAVSNYIKSEISKIDPNCDIRVVYNGLNDSIFKPCITSTTNRTILGLKKDDFVVVFWGRLIPGKGIKELLESLFYLKEHHDIKLLIIGSINYEDANNNTNSFLEELRQMANDLDDKVIFTGFVKHNKIPDFLSISDVAVIPSIINEAFGMTCIEACAMGLPVIATNDGGIPEALFGQKHILIDKSKDIPIQIKDGILEIKKNYSQYKGNRLHSTFTKEIYAKSFFKSIEITLQNGK